MKTRISVLMIFISLAGAIGCSKSKEETRILMLGATGSLFQPGSNPAFNGQSVIEASLINEGNSITMFYDPKFNGEFWVTSITSPIIEGWKAGTHISNNLRFPYTLKHKDIYYNFALLGRDIYLWSSEDGMNWKMLNNNQPVLTHSTEANSIYYNLWNVGVTIDAKDVWHLIVECAPNTAGQAGVGLAYATATLQNDLISFDANRTKEHVVHGGGNPWLQYIPERHALISIHGTINPEDPSPFTKNQSFWYLSASTFDIDQQEWTTHLDDFYIGFPGIHVADPHVVEFNDSGKVKTYMTFSYDQRYIYEAYSAHTVLDIFDSLNGQTPLKTGDSPGSDK